MKSLSEIFRTRVTGMFAFAVLALATFVSPARATLISIDRLTAGDGQLTRDTASGLDWLDVTLTLNQSQASAAGLTGSGSLYEGFRLATVAEFQTLVANAGVHYGLSTNPLHIAAAHSLQNLLGLTSVFSDSSAVYSNSNGWLAGSLSGNANLGFIQITDYHPRGNTDFSIADNGGGAGNASSAFGLFLVRSSPSMGTGVPDGGSTVGLLALAMAGLFAFRRRLAAALAGSDIS